MTNFFYPFLSGVFRSRKGNVVTLLFSIFLYSSYAQVEMEDYQSSLTEWRNGSVQINEKTIIKGLIRYNWMENILTLKTKEGTRTFNAQNIQRFDMDDATGRKHFISSPDQKTTDENPTGYFFEILKECKHFALMMYERAYAYQDVQTNVTYMSSSTTRKVVIEKKLYIFDDDGNINPYMIMTETNALGFTAFYSPTKRKSKVLDKKLLARYFGDRYVQVKAYAKENKLSFRDKRELITILTYFKKLELI